MHEPTHIIPHILVLEDSVADAELVAYELRRAGLQFILRHVTDKAEFLAELEKFQPDIVLSDFSLPQFTGLEALRLVNRFPREIPFILVTGSQTEEVAVECMKEGAVDYILKTNLLRLPSAVRNALKQLESDRQRVAAETALRKSEEQLLQSQKLEAIGRLAGGISHDFNNLLTAIIGYSDLSLRQLQQDDPLTRNLEEIKKAGDRATALTRQLLAFSRKQVMQLRVFDLNAVVVDLERMLKRMIGENIELRTTLQQGLGNIKADPGQIEQVVMNLVVNSRDAMPQGGKLTIETANVYLDESYVEQHLTVVPGYYIMLAVSDTGLGIDERVRPHIFEPFFTTKDAARGTGLGLSTVYGIVKQSGGFIWVYSEIGKGTTFKIYFPTVAQNVDELKAVNLNPPAQKGSETILLVEDAEPVRRLARTILEGFGYEVLLAANGSEAKHLCELNQHQINLLLTDVILPGISGREVAEQVLRINPAIRVLFMSGYTDDAVIGHDILSAGVNFIQKPFSPDQLGAKVREVLDAVNTQPVS
jgi:two-component system, cell cycle sensor histidine kinase and response regulator CckA